MSIFERYCLWKPVAKMGGSDGVYSLTSLDAFRLRRSKQCRRHRASHVRESRKSNRHNICNDWKQNQEQQGTTLHNLENLHAGTCQLYSIGQASSLTTHRQPRSFTQRIWPGHKQSRLHFFIRSAQLNDIYITIPFHVLHLPRLQQTTFLPSPSPRT